MKKYIKPSVTLTTLEIEEAILTVSQVGVIETPMDWENGLSNEFQTFDVWN